MRMNWYCNAAPGHPVHGPYHDEEYGFPGRDTRALFELLSLEIFQPGLSWLLVLKKRQGIIKAFHNFDIDTVASFGEDDLKRLLADKNIIRNRLKINSIIYNARQLQAIGRDHKGGGFADWLAAHHPRTKKEWVKLFKKTFKFTGPEVTNEFLMGSGYLPGAHGEECPVYDKILRLNPPWMKAGKAFYEQE